MRWFDFYKPTVPAEADEDIRRFVGPNHRYYIYKWAFARGFSRWNLAALFWGPAWFGYRRLLAAAVVFAALLLLGDFLLTVNPWHFTVSVEAALLAAWLANPLYGRRFRRAKALSPSPAALQAAGGVRWWWPPVILAGMLAVNFLLPAAFGVSLYRTRVVRLEAGSLLYAWLSPEYRSRELSLLRRDYQQAFLRGDFKRSLSVNEGALKAAILKFGRDHPYALGAQYELLSDKLTAGLHREARTLTEEAVRQYEIRFGPEHPFAAFMRNNVVSIDLYQGQYGRARSGSFNILLILEKYKKSENDPVILSNYAAIYSNQGVIQQLWGEQEEAEKNHTEALNLALRAANGPNIEICRYLERLGDWYLEQQRLEDAKRLYDQERVIAERTVGLENPLLSSVWLKLGVLHYLRHQLPEAEKSLARAHAIHERFYGDRHMATAESAFQLGRVYFSEGRLFEAEERIDQSLEITSRAIGERNALYAKYLTAKIDLYLFRNDIKAAEQALQASLAALTEVYGPDHPRLLIPLGQLLRLYAQSGRAAEERRIRTRVQDIRERWPRAEPGRPHFYLDLDGLML
ncbi:MAG: tetratricopeptide repeat protein [candidate division FCPU426 bacterium]